MAWAGGKKLCRHNPIVINPALKTEKGTFEVAKCSKCGALRTKKKS